MSRLQPVPRPMGFRPGSAVEPCHAPQGAAPTRARSPIGQPLGHRGSLGFTGGLPWPSRLKMVRVPSSTRGRRHGDEAWCARIRTHPAPQTRQLLDRPQRDATRRAHPRADLRASGLRAWHRRAAAPPCAAVEMFSVRRFAAGPDSRWHWPVPPRHHAARMARTAPSSARSRRAPHGHQQAAICAGWLAAMRMPKASRLALGKGVAARAAPGSVSGHGGSVSAAGAPGGRRGCEEVPQVVPMGRRCSGWQCTPRSAASVRRISTLLVQGWLRGSPAASRGPP